MAGTSLAEQLKKLAAPQTSILAHRKKRLSLLFDPKDAADINRETFFKIGLSGLEELKTLQPRFAEFEKTLFDETSQHLERAVQDQSTNAKLDQLIHRFLFLLSPYVNLKATHKALEWLICRFHIHEYNVDSILALFLPYHDTNIFARMVQILSLEDKGGRWIWLQNLKKEGIPMSKLFLLSRASSDTSFLKFVCNLPLQAVQVYGEKSYCLTTLFAFYCTTVIGALDQSTQVSEVQLTHLLPSLMAGINSSHVDFTASAFMILGHLVTKIRLTAGIFSELFYKVSRSEQPSLRSEAALVLVVMAQRGRPPPISASSLHLAAATWFLPALTQLADAGVVVYPLVAAIVSDCLGMLNTKQHNCDKQDILQSFLSKLLEQLSFNDEEAGKLFKIFAEFPLDTNKWYHDILHQLEKSYPMAFDKAVQVNSSLIGLIPGYTARNDIFQRLNHPESNIRLEAINYIKSQDNLLNESWVKEALLDRLADESTAVISSVIKLANHLPRHQLREHLIVLAARCWHSDIGLYCLGPLVLRHLRSQKETDATLLLLVLPYLLLPDDSRLSVAEAVLKSGAVQNLQLLKPLGKKLRNSEISVKSLCAEVFKFISKELSHVNMDDVLKAGKQLESHGMVYQLMALVVAAGTLQGQISLVSLKPLIEILSQYNNCSLSSAVHGELDKENIANIVNLCRNGKLPFQGSLYVLSVISKKMKSPFPEGKYIFDVMEPSIALVAVIFGFVINMKKCKNQYISEAYSKFCNKMFKKCCPNTENQIDLLSNIALGFPNIADECIVLISQLVEELSSVSEHILVPALLVALRSEDEQARRNALSLLHSLTQKLAVPTYHKLLDQLSLHSHEIAVDHEQVNVALYLCLSPDPSVQALLSKSLRLDMAVVLHSLINIIVAPDTPPYISSSLLKTLDQVNSQSLLERLLPIGMKILLSEKRSLDEVSVMQAVIRRINTTTASAFNENYIWTFLEACLKDPNIESTDGLTPVLLMLQQVDRELFTALSAEQQERLLSLVVSCVAETEHSDVTSAAASVFKRVSLDANILISLLERMRDVTIEHPAQSTKKRGWNVKQPPPLELLKTTAWKQGICLLEFIQNKKKVENVQVLLPRLFEILNRCLQFEEQSPVEYTKQVLLTSLLHCCGKLSAPGGCPVDLPESSMQVELVVECIRVSSNPQTHHHALLLLAYMANMIPERVLHCVMPIFTFMGSSVLRQDDAYSFQIISKIIETIVPVLIKSREDEELTPEVVGVLRVFATALLDIPEHRRTPLYTKLLRTLHQGRFLWAFLSLVFETHVLHPSPDNANTAKEPGSIPKRLEVCLQLCHQFPPTTILFTASQLINYLCQLPVDKGDKRLKEFKTSSIGSLFDVERVTDKQLRHYTYTALTFLSFLLSSKQFLRVMAALATEEIEDMKETFQKMFEGILTFTQTVLKQMDLSVGQLSAKYWKSMFNICFDVLAKTNALLPGDMFLDVIASLLVHPLVSLRCKSLELLIWRLQQGRPMDSGRLLCLLKPLLSLVKAESTEQHTQQIALLAIKLLARQLAADHSVEFQPVFKAATKILKKRSIQDPVLASAVLCIGELCHTLRAHAIISLPNFMPAILSILQNDKIVGSGDLLLVSVVSAVHKIVDSLISFLSPYLDQLLQHLCKLSAQCAQLSDNPKLQPVLQKIKYIRQTISADVPLRVLLPAVTESYSRLVCDNNTSAVPHLMSLLGNSFKPGQQVNQDLTSFFLTALDFRSQSLSEADINVIEPAVISAAIALVLKLSESSFRPLYYKIFNWAFQSDDNRDRSITFYKLTCNIAESLKGLFLSFAHYFLKNAATLLDENNKIKQQLSWSPSKANELVDAILKALHTVFVHDTSHFINKERFDTLMLPIVDQLENELGGAETMERRTTCRVIPCLTQMAVSAADDTLWKQLNYQILLKTRHNLPQVRIGGVLSVCEIAKKLGEEFLPLLPETVPFLAELLEDEDENVEKSSKRVVQELEAALGEPISKYF